MSIEKELVMEQWQSGTGQILNVHSRSACTGPCAIHRPSSHHMVTWLLHWREDRCLMERICKHGIGHPDPDDASFRARIFGDTDATHGCDGCCQRP